MSKFALFVVGLTWLPSVSVVAMEPSEREELKYIFAIMKKTERSEHYDRANLPEVYRYAHQKLADLKVSESNRSKLLQARTLIAVLGQQWDDFSSLAKEFDEKDFWFLNVKIWQLQMRVAREEWTSLADDVDWLIDDLMKKQLNLADANKPSEVGNNLLILRQALISPQEKELPQELQIVADRIDRLKDTYAKAYQGRPDKIYPGFAEDFEWLSKVDVLSGSFTREQLKAMIADQRSTVAAAGAEAKIASKKRADGQANRTNFGEDEYWKTKRRSRFEADKLALLRDFERTSESQLSMAFRARLWVWQSSVNQNTEYFKFNWTFGLVDAINRKP